MMKQKYVQFENLGHRPLPYQIIGKRRPKKGEHFLSGAVVQAFQAPNDLPTAYYVVRPIEKEI
jgi:hypothetical protein